MSKGFFDKTAVNLGWFDETAQGKGWFDEALLNVTSTSSQTLTQSTRFNNSNSFYAPIVGTGAVSLSPALLTNTQSFFGAIVGAGAVSLLPPAISNSQAIYAPTVTVGSVSLSASRLNNSNAFYSPTLSAGGVTLLPGILNNANTIYSPVVTTGALSLVQSSRIDNSNIFYSPRVSEGLTLSPADIEAIADAVWARALEGLRADEMMRIMFAALAGKREGLGTATEFYMAQDGVTPRITLTPDQYGNGTPIVNGGA